MNRPVSGPLRVVGAVLAIPIVLAVARLGLAWPLPPAPAATPRPFAFSSGGSPPPTYGPAPRPSAVAVIVYVAGAVARPGLVSLPAGTRVAAALSRTGPRADADLVAVNLAARVEDGEEIVVPTKGAATAPSASARRATRSRSPQRARAAPTPATPISLNQADVRQLARVPGIGVRLAERIVAYRETYGPFASTEDLLDVAGVTERGLERAAPFLRP